MKASDLKFTNYSTWIQKKNDYDWYDWCVFCSASPETLAEIRAIEYTLHPTFQDPVRTITDREHGFALLSSGWGGFKITISVFGVDGSTIRVSHFLNLEQDNWPRKKAETFYDLETKRIYDALLHEKFRWRKATTIAKHATLTETKVLGGLRKLESQELVRKAPIQSVDNQDLWGATAIVGVLPRP